jgi:hypothetical protein
MEGKMFSKINDLITADQALSGKSLRLLSLVFLFIAGMMSFGEYVKVREWWFDAKVTFYPDHVTTILALFLVSPLYVRNILKWNKSFYSIISAFLILFVFSSFIQLALGGRGFYNKTMLYGMLLCFILSWLGMRAISGMCWLIIIFFGVYSFIETGVALGFYGFIYITLGFMGLVLHTDLNPGALFKELKSEFRGTTESIVTVAKENVNETRNAINQYKEST